jgi:hypothetical protein
MMTAWVVAGVGNACRRVSPCKAPSVGAAHRGVRRCVRTRTVSVTCKAVRTPAVRVVAGWAGAGGSAAARSGLGAGEGGPPRARLRYGRTGGAGAPGQVQQRRRKHPPQVWHQVCLWGQVRAGVAAWGGWGAARQKCEEIGHKWVDLQSVRGTCGVGHCPHASPPRVFCVFLNSAHEEPGCGGLTMKRGAGWRARGRAAVANGSWLFWLVFGVFSLAKAG